MRHKLLLVVIDVITKPDIEMLGYNFIDVLINPVIDFGNVRGWHKNYIPGL
jgi:hypothetical protein